MSFSLDQLPKHFETKTAEFKWDEFWQSHKIYHFNDEKSRSENFSIDTPPPTVSGSLHIGHIFSYVQTDLIARFQRMRGKNVFYPMGWDDNGLPTERRVQNLYHVRCDPELPYEPNLKFEVPSAKQKKEPARVVSRQNFIELCHEVTREDEQAFMALFRRIGLSVDWRQEYATINDHCRKISQLSFLDLYKKGEVYQNETPGLWDVDFQTAVAQAELEDREMEGAYHHIEFAVEGSEDKFVIATTRPELLPACIGVATHPDDSRFKHLIGKQALTPLFEMPVPIFGSELVDPEKGTGILMVCSFGDQTDVQWWREQKLPLRQVLNRVGRFVSIPFGEDLWPSRNTSRAKNAYAELEGKNVKQARAKIVELLQQPDSSVDQSKAALTKEPEKIQHAVKFFEKGDRPLEFITTRQWYVSLLKHKDRLLELAESVQWHPEYMKARYLSWTQNLNLDWCVSRQRYFGVAIPVWYKLNAQGETIFSEVILPDANELPVDPMSDTPKGYSPDQRGKPNGFVGERDVFDTWFTSSMSPQIGSHWGLSTSRHHKIFPMDLRPQGHEIIRTWAFYTMAKSMLHEGTEPWKHIALSGWIVDPNRKKMSKSKGNTITPQALIEDYGSDAIRYWAANARLGADTAYDEQIFKVGRRLVTKLYNAAKFVLGHEHKEAKISEAIDKAFLTKLATCVERATTSFEKFNYAQAIQEIEKFFWSHFTDTYIELVKLRARESGPEADSAVATLHISLQTFLKLFAPYLPFLTEEIWSWTYAKNSQSIHQESWPSAESLVKSTDSGDPEFFEIAMDALTTINKWKTENGMKLNAEVDTLRLTGKESSINKLRSSLQRDLEKSCRISKIEFVKGESEENSSFRVEV